MLTIEDFDQHVLVEYKRDYRRFPKGVVVAIGPGMVGWALRNKKDKFDKKLGLNIALKRALKMKGLNEEESVQYVLDHLPRSLEDMFDEMVERSYLYFKSTIKLTPSKE